MSFIHYKYYDTPDGEDIFKKLFYLTKMSVFPATFVAMPNMILANVPKTYLQGSAQVLRYAGPWVTSALTYGSFTYIATTVRKKDDPWNAAVGGAFTGAIWAVKFQKAGGLLRGYMVLGGAFLGYWAKHNHVHKWNRYGFPEARIHNSHMGPHGWKQDLSLHTYGRKS